MRSRKSKPNQLQSFKPYKGVSSNSPPLQFQILHLLVSNPIREYLQIPHSPTSSPPQAGFKPYKGVSSNAGSSYSFYNDFGFKPYKGVSSNMKLSRSLCIASIVSNPIREYLQISVMLEIVRDGSSFKPYKGVSSNKNRKIDAHFLICFKPYKGVSSNLYNNYTFTVVLGFKPYKGVSSN